MDWIMGVVLVGAVVLVSGYAYYKYLVRSTEAAGRLLTLIRAGQDAMRALKKFDEMAEERYGPGELPEHLKNVRNEIKSTIDTLMGDDE